MRLIAPALEAKATRRSASEIAPPRAMSPRHLIPGARRNTVTPSDQPRAFAQQPPHHPPEVAEPPQQWPQDNPWSVAIEGEIHERRDTDTIRVLLVEAMSLMRGALVALLAEASGIEVVAQLDCDHQVLSAANRLRPDVIVVDVDQPGDDGLAVIQKLHEDLPECHVLALVVAARPGLVRRALDAQVTGALDKDASPGRLAESIRRIARGERVIDANLAVAALCVTSSPLTARELDVLRLAAEGASAREIAAELSLSGGTVRNYLSRVVTKTGARSRIDAIRIAREAAWL
jgi:two-component system, NarL family, response regulator DesR